MQKTVVVCLLLIAIGAFIVGGTLVANSTSSYPIISYSLEYQIASTVLIEIDGRHTGSGFIVAPDLIITARHVVDRRGDYAILFADGTRRNVQAIRISEVSDCAVLQVRKAGLRPLTLTTKIRVGQPITVIGSPLDPAYFNYVTRGIVSKLDVQEDWLSDNPVIMIDAAVNGGNSGGPVFDMKGRVIGIAIAGYTHNCGMNFITPAADIIALLSGWKDEGENYGGRYEETEEARENEYDGAAGDC